MVWPKLGLCYEFLSDLVCYRNIARLRRQTLRPTILCTHQRICGLTLIPSKSESTLTCGLARIFPYVHRPHCDRLETGQARI